MFEPVQPKRQKPSVKFLINLPRQYPFWLSLMAGAISATGFAPLGLWPVSLLALALWIAIVDRLGSRKSVFFSGWLFGLGHFVVGLNWIAKAFTFQAAMPEWLGYIAVVLLSLYLAVYPALTALGAWLLARGRRLAFVLAFAGFWIITEWLRSWVFSGFIWNPLGVIAVDAGLALSARSIGTYGLSGLTIGVAGLVGSAVIGMLTLQWRLIVRRVFDLAIVALGAGILFLIGSREDLWNGDVMDFGAIAICKEGWAENCGPPNITVVQPNIGQQDKWQAGYEELNLGKLAGLTVRKDDTPRLVFWPEAAIPDYLETGYPQRYYYGRPPQMVRAQLAGLMKPGDVLVLGGLKLEFDDASAPDERRAIGARNSVFAMDSERELLGRYDKSHLVPYGEYLPMRPLLSALGLSRLAPGDFDFWPGPGPRSLDLGAFGKAGLQVCYEIIFSGQVVDRDNRPDFIFNPSNDAWFGAWGPPQHLAQAQMRAIEEGLPVIRSTPTGISAVITSRGKVVESIPMGQAGRIDTILPSPEKPTLFSLYGNVLSLGFAFFLLICAIAIRLRAR
ncbi:apolipoprotein N-acyltransferase [Parasphingorhabdus cellanae]|uniref:Apolipoprotein N-acyltransferase n=1 Tax=Parasphingorhabdus cellanae TaxID=2806553 RepID=A0ABX7T290_9SPHN|nr:apolipoprotein N-acyltransferase [Parasphingorhabdus cellanae]QTD55068.1 apolipoprotein N-acyltransferase [Parasphingorhabdus cellanae]